MILKSLAGKDRLANNVGHNQKHKKNKKLQLDPFTSNGLLACVTNENEETKREHR
jgi:hypothetical protein